MLRALQLGFERLGHRVQFHSHVEKNLYTEPFGNLPLVAGAFADNYVLKARGWDSLVSFYRDRHQLDKIFEAEADITILRWMNGMLGDFAKFEPQKWGKIAWGLPDTNPFTGVCHYSSGCDGYQTDCSGCPALKTPFAGMATKNLNKKKMILEKFNPDFVAPTDWMLETAKKSSILKPYKISKILNPLQPFFFESEGTVVSSGPVVRVAIIAANLDDPTKGVWREISVLKSLANNRGFEISMIGLYSRKLATALPEAKFFGQLDSRAVLSRLRLVDVLLVPSLFETAGMVIAEAASQGVSAIVRNVGGMPEMTNYGRNGFVFSDTDELISIFANLSKRELEKKSSNSLEWSQQLRPEVAARKYLHLLGA